MRNRKAILNFIISVEQRYAINGWRVEGFKVWPLIRIKLYFLLINGFDRSANTTPVEKSTPSLMSRLLKYFESIFYRISLLFIVKQNIDTFYSGFYSHRTLLNDKYFNKFFDPIIIDEEKQGIRSFIAEYRQPKEKIEYFHPSRVIKAYSIFLYARLFTKIKKFDIPSDFTKAIIDEANEQFNLKIEVEKFDRSLNEDINKVIIYRKAFEILLYKFRPKKVVCLCYYNLSMMGLILAAKNKNILTVDMQHGHQGSVHLSYAGWSNVPKDGYELLPDVFWCWNEVCYNEIASWTSDTNHAVELFGNPWIKLWKSSFIKSDYDKWPPNLVLYTIQPLGKLLDDFIIDAIKSSKGEINWWLRLHPRNLHEMEDLKRILKNNDINSYVNVDQATNLPLPDILRHTCVHITKYSGSIIEALDFNVPSIITDSIGVEEFSDYLNHPLIAVDLSGNKDNLISVINRHLEGWKYHKS